MKNGAQFGSELNLEKSTASPSQSSSAMCSALQHAQDDMLGEGSLSLLYAAVSAQNTTEQAGLCFT